MAAEGARVIEAFAFLQIMAWPGVAFTALFLFASAWDDYASKRKAELERATALVADAVTEAATAHAAVARLAERVGQLEIAQGVKRGR